MARKIKNVHLDRAQEKQKKQKKILFVLLPIFVLLLAMEVPKTMKLMGHGARPPVVSAAGSAPAANPQSTTTTQLPPQALAQQQAQATAPAQSIVASVPVQAGAGQLTQFERFASKDPFTQSVQKLGGASTPGGSTQASKPPKTPTTTTTTTTTTATTPTPPVPPPGSAVISVNGELTNVTTGTDFPTSGTVFNQVGASLFHLVSLTQKTAKVSIAGGSYADGAASLTLHVGEPVTLQNTADGTRYTLILEPQGTPVPAAGTTGSMSTTTRATTTPSVVPSSSSGG